MLSINSSKKVVDIHGLNAKVTLNNLSGYRTIKISRYKVTRSFFQKSDQYTLEPAVIKREKICDNCKVSAEVEKEASLLDIINSLQLSEQKAVFKYLARKLADSEEL